MTIRRIASTSFIAALSFVSGCASPEQLRAQAMNTPEPELCYLAVTAGASVRNAAYYGIQARGINCALYQGMVMARIQANQQQQQLGLQLLQAGQPRPSTMPTPIYCRTVYQGNVARTVCD